jgi:FkbM family methyltransferase
MGIDNTHRTSEKGLLNCLNQLNKKAHATHGLTILDIGANEGQFSTLLNQVFNQPNVFAFEPHPLTFSRLSQNLAQAPNVKTIPMGCGDVQGILKMYDYESGSGSEHATLVEGVINNIHGGTSKSVDVEVTTIDTFCKSSSIHKLFLLKIDTEGYEYNVLKGSTHMLTQTKYVLFEFNSMNMKSHVFMNDFKELLGEFDLYRIVKDGLIPLENHVLLSEMFAFQNILAVNKNL